MNNRRKLLAAFGSLPIVVPLRSAAQQPVWRIGYPPFGAPLSFLPGATPETFRTMDPDNAQGALIDVCRAIGKVAGDHIRFFAFTAGELPHAMSSGRIDLRSNASGVRAQDFMDVSDPIFDDSEVLVAHRSDAMSYVSYDDLKGLLVGSRTGTATEDDLKANGQSVKSYATIPELFAAVEAGEVKVAVNTAYVPTAHVLSRGQYPNVKIVTSYRPRFPRATGIGIRKGGPVSLATVNTLLAGLKADGTVHAVFARYGIADTLSK